MGQASLENNTRFADTFLHPWESRADIHQWFSAFNKAGLRPVSLYDRYAELDDLENTLWTCPTVAQLSDRADDLRYENNIEIWLTRDDSLIPREEAASQKANRANIPLRLRMTMPASQLSQFIETRHLPIGAKLVIWRGFLKSLYGQKDKNTEDLLRGLDVSSLKRLARIGLILPQTAEKLNLGDSLVKPIHGSMNPPTLTGTTELVDSVKASKIISKISQSTQKKAQALKRFIRAM
jgi:hypothetical protein